MPVLEMKSQPRVALVSRGDEAERQSGEGRSGRFHAVFAALEAHGLAPEPAIYDEAWDEAFRAQLLEVSAALVWVNPVQDGRRRNALDAALRDIAAAGVLVSAHPDVIDKMGVKAVLHATRSMPWGTDTRHYRTMNELVAGLDETLEGGPRVLKPNRGNGGFGVRKVEALPDGRFWVVEADGAQGERIVSWPDLLAEWAEPMAAAGGVVDQPFVPRISEGMVRCYMSGNRVAGFGHQRVRALAPPGAPSGPRLYSGPDDARFQPLRAVMQDSWTPQMAALLALTPDALPVIWDADFLLGPKDSAGVDTYVLCEINASSVFPIPDEAADAIAGTLAARLGARLV